ncbi:MAG TPA: hypothetical protein P5250_01365 [Bacteroidales bacterium]|nr:hypothetical protein [Bacteroidales bacterium]
MAILPYKIKITSNIIFSLFILIIITTSCKKDEYNLNKLSTSGEWSPDVALPLVYASLSLEDVLADYEHTNYITDSSNLCYLVYQNKVFSNNAENIIHIPNQFVNTTATININGNSLPIGNDETTNINKLYTFNFANGEIIDSIYIKSGLLTFNVNSNLNYDATIIVTFPSLITPNNTPFSKTLTLTAGYNPTYQLNIDGCIMKFGIGGASSNQIPIQYTIIVHGNGSPNNSPYTINFNESFLDIKFSKIYGYLGQFSFDVPTDTVNIKLYNNYLWGYIDYEDSRIYLNMNSSLGIPLKMHVTDFEAKNSNNSTNSIFIIGNGVPLFYSPYIIQPAPFTYPFSISETIKLNKYNSNVSNAMLISPNYFYCKPNINTNPSGLTHNFAFDTSKFSFNMKVELPLHDDAWNFIFQDTIPFNLDNIEKMEYLQLNIDLSNKFPIDAILQIYLVDSTNTKLDSLFKPNQNIIIAATPGPAPDYLVTNPVKKYTTIIMDKARLQKLKNIKKLFIRSHLVSYNNGANTVKIYSFYTIDVKISARAKMKVDY